VTVCGRCGSSQVFVGRGKIMGEDCVTVACRKCEFIDIKRDEV